MQPRSARIRARRACVWAKYLMPFLLCLLVWALCALPLWRFSSGDGEIKENQTLFGLMSTTYESSKATLNKDGAESQDVILAKALIPLPYVFWTIMAVSLVSSAILFFFAPAILPKDPESLEANRTKVKFKLVFPGAFWHFLLPLLTVSPLFIPYYMVNRFTKYYGVRSLENLESGAKEYTYYNYSIKYDNFNPIIPCLVVAGLALILFFVAIPYERGQKMSMYRYYDPPEQDETPARRRSR